MKNNNQIIGIDVSKDMIDVVVHHGKHKQFSSDKIGRKDDYVYDIIDRWI